MAKYEIHEACTIFPEMSPDALQALADDIRANGLQEPIWLYEGKIIDGRSRYRACEMAGVKPDFRGWEGDSSPIDFVVSLNLHRRHLTASQQAMVATEIKRRLEAEIAEETRRKQSEAGKRIHRSSPASAPTEKVLGKIANDLSDDELQEAVSVPVSRNARSEAASIVGVSPRYITEAERIVEKSPETAEAVRRGEITIPQAKRQLGLAPPSVAPAPEEDGEDETPNGSLFQPDLLPEETDEEIGDRSADAWTKLLMKLCNYRVSLVRRGGIRKLTRRWTKDRIRGYISTINDTIKFFESIREELKGGLDDPAKPRRK